MKAFSSQNVYDAAVARSVKAYEDGHRLIVSFSAGKDSTAVLEVVIEAARMTGNLPVEMWMRDEEIMYPGTYEYAERVYHRDEVNMHWLYSAQPAINVFNREHPYYWVFDYLLDPSEWMRSPPDFAKKTGELSLYNIVHPNAFPPPKGKLLYVTMGVRASESRKRNMMIHRAGGELSGASDSNEGGRDRHLERHFRPIYDWSTKDVWLAIKEKGWDYNHAYDVMTRYGLARERQRIAPVTMTVHGIPLLQLASKAWPEWFARLNTRLPGVGLGAKYGKKAVIPIRRHYETWQSAYQRLCIDEAPAWIAERAIQYREIMKQKHAVHATTPILEMAACPTCSSGRVSWKAMTNNLYDGDPHVLSTECEKLGYLEPEDVRPGAGRYNGKPNF